MVTNNNQSRDIDFFFLLEVIYLKKYLILFLTLLIFISSFYFNSRIYNYKIIAELKFDNVETFIPSIWMDKSKFDFEDFSKLRNQFFINSLVDENNLETVVKSFNNNYKINKKISKVINYKIKNYIRNTIIKVEYDFYMGSNNEEEYNKFVKEHLEQTLEVSVNRFKNDYEYFIEKNKSVNLSNLDNKISSLGINYHYLLNRMTLIKKQEENIRAENERVDLRSLKLKIADKIFENRLNISIAEDNREKFLQSLKNFAYETIDPQHIIERIVVKEKIVNNTYQVPGLLIGLLFSLFISTIFVYFKIEFIKKSK